MGRHLRYLNRINQAKECKRMGAFVVRALGHRVACGRIQGLHHARLVDLLDFGVVRQRRCLEAESSPAIPPDLAAPPKLPQRVFLQPLLQRFLLQTSEEGLAVFLLTDDHILGRV